MNTQEGKDWEHEGETVVSRLPCKIETKQNKTKLPLTLGVKPVSNEEGNFVCASGGLAQDCQDVLIEHLNG